MLNLYATFTVLQLRNMIFYIIGICFYKFMLESLNSSVNNIILSRVNKSDLPAYLGVADIWTILQSINLLCQCIGSFLVAPLLQRYNSKYVLSFAILIFGIIIGIIPILELATGGSIPPEKSYEKKEYFGYWCSVCQYG